MNNKKLRILFDASMLVHGFNDPRSRGGIYFVARNILDILSKQSDIELALISNVCDVVALSRFRSVEYPKLKLYREPTKNDKRYIAIVDSLKKIRNQYSNLSLLRKGLYVFIRLLEKIHTILHRYTFEQFAHEKWVYFSPNSPASAAMRKAGLQGFVILHDLIPYKLNEYKNFRNIGWFKKIIASLNKNDTYFAVSQATKNDLNLFKDRLDVKKVNVLPLAASRKFKRCPDENDLVKIQEKYGLPRKKFVFSLSSLEPRKNLLRAVSCFISFVEKHKINDLIFVLGGIAGTKIAENLKQELKGLDASIILPIGFVDDDDVPVFYSNAEWFVYTSQYEGFGLPPLEAMQCGCPVITSNNSSLPEVVGDAGLMIDWDSDEQHIDAYEKYYFNEELRKENAKRGLERAKLFSWEKTVDEMCRIMRNPKRDKLNIIYRVCDAVAISSGNNRCFDVAKKQLIEKCLLSLEKNIFKYEGEFDFICFADNCSEGLLSFIQEHFPKAKIKRFDKLGNAKSFYECVKFASELPDGEQVYFLEDDYLFLKDDILNMLNSNLMRLSLHNGCNVGIMTDDYPDRYVDNRIMTECCVTETGHFLKINKTTCTFATYTDVVKKNKKYLLKFIEWPNVDEDESINKMWKKVPLYQPIPAWTLHCQSKAVIPLYLDYDEIKDYFEK